MLRVAAVLARQQVLPLLLGRRGLQGTTITTMERGSSRALACR